MEEICFRKIKSRMGEEFLVMFEQGEITKPLFILEKKTIDKLNEEWNEKL